MADVAEQPLDGGEPGEDTVVVQPRPGVKVYGNPRGLIVIRNFGSEDDDELFALVHPEDAEAVSRALLEVAESLMEDRPETHRART